jgi:hypothetical protein
VGPHGWPAGPAGDGQDTQSGVPVRILTPLFHRYGVDAVLAAHDEIWERSEVPGEELLPDGNRRPHVLHVYDLGVAGDGLRGPEPGLVNPFQQFLVHTHAPEVWLDGVLMEGGKHYGHLEIEVQPVGATGWQAVLQPVYVFPRFADRGATYLGYERRLYRDTVTLSAQIPVTAVGADAEAASQATSLLVPYPNPGNGAILLRYVLGRAGAVRLDVYDTLGRRIRCLVDAQQEAGYHSVTWDGLDQSGANVASGVYLVQLQTGAERDSTEVVLTR